jgi:hypothetical protein
MKNVIEVLRFIIFCAQVSGRTVDIYFALGEA